MRQQLHAASSQRDILSNVVGKVKAGNIELEQLNAHASMLIIAGAESVATVQAAILYNLLTSPSALVRVRDEIRRLLGTQVCANSLEVLGLCC